MSDNNVSFAGLRADCTNCFGLCCVALYFSASEGFPADKNAGQPCDNLQSDFRCKVHKNLCDMGLNGCVTYDCLGAGQKVAQVTFSRKSWRDVPESAKQMFDIFLVMQQLHEMLWYLAEALTLAPSRPIHNELWSTLDETARITHLGSEELINLNLAEHRRKVNALLVETSNLVRAQGSSGSKTDLGSKKTLTRGVDLIGADLRNINLCGANLRGALLIATDLRGVDLSGADLIGADLRDSDLRAADLSRSIFLIQTQINSARGDVNTKLPPQLTRPAHWASTKSE